MGKKLFIDFRLVAFSFSANLKGVCWCGARQTGSGPITRRLKKVFFYKKVFFTKVFPDTTLEIFKNVSIRQFCILGERGDGPIRGYNCHLSQVPVKCFVFPLKVFSR